MLAGSGSAPTLVFDEVDSGIGGATAAAVGERLAAALGQAAQLLVVTHSPQVAAQATHHWRVEKSSGKAGNLTGVVALDGPARREEIARMLSGATVTDEARAAADRLIAAGGRRMKKPQKAAAGETGRQADQGRGEGRRLPISQAEIAHHNQLYHQKDAPEISRRGL